MNVLKKSMKEPFRGIGKMGKRVTSIKENKKKKGQKIVFNPDFKTLCWKIGESFVKQSNREGDVYGHLYKEKRKYYEEKNEEGGFADRAAEILKTKKLIYT